MQITVLIVLAALVACLAADPSMKAQLDPTGKSKYAERSRIIVDLDGDGIDDMLAKGDPALGLQTLMLNRKLCLESGLLVAFWLACLR